MTIFKSHRNNNNNKRNTITSLVYSRPGIYALTIISIFAIVYVINTFTTLQSDDFIDTATGLERKDDSTVLLRSKADDDGNDSLPGVEVNHSHLRSSSSEDVEPANNNNTNTNLSATTSTSIATLTKDKNETETELLQQLSSSSSTLNPSFAPTPAPIQSQLQNTTDTPHRSKNAYVLLLDKRSLECPARILASRLQTVDPHTDIVILVVGTPESLPVTFPTTSQNPTSSIYIVHVPPPATKGSLTWLNTFAKFYAGRLLDYHTVLFLDLDVVVLQSPSLYFDLTDEYDFDVAAPIAYWLTNQPFYMSGGPMLIRPSSRLEQRIRAVLDGGGPSLVGFDSEMDWFNVEFGRDVHVLDDDGGFSCLLNGEFVEGDGIYRYFEKKMGLGSAVEVLDKAVMVHFIAGWKPWLGQIRHELNKGSSSLELKKIMDIWDREKENVC